MANETTSRDSPARSAASITGLTLLRVIVGAIMVAHGSQKFADLAGFQSQVAELGFPWPEVFARLAVVGELLGGAGLVLGFLTPLAAFGVLAVLVAAILSVHLEHGLFAAQGGFEYPLALGCAALFFLLNGAGPVSVDAVLADAGRRRGGRKLGVPRAASEAPAFAREHFDPRPSGHVPSDGPVDPVTRAGMESFPASDPPARGQR